MKKYEGQSIRQGRTDCGKLPANVGFPGNMQGVTRKLTIKERARQKELGRVYTKRYGNV